VHLILVVMRGGESTTNNALFLQIQEQIAKRVNNRKCSHALRDSKSDLKSAFDSHCISTTGKLDMGSLNSVLERINFDINDLDTSHIYIDSQKEGLSFEELVRLIESPSPFEQIAQTFPFWRLLSDSIPRTGVYCHRPSHEKISAVERLATLNTTEIECMVDAMAHELKAMLRDFCDNLKKTSESQKVQLQHRDSKYSIETYNAGSLRDFHDGLGGRVGYALPFM
jgi:hypothetical protein